MQSLPAREDNKNANPVSTSTFVSADYFVQPSAISDGYPTYPRSRSSPELPTYPRSLFSPKIPTYPRSRLAPKLPTYACSLFSPKPLFYT
ncbi:hypothetical protein N7516_002843 [Penicillium verrucosum]|uniref:uncharacterized protein n=1 Tax=Penicillium verrucosum TaxID=60171 RepID=UPI00254567E6|nr:uncharacterized protein N7516_002843 [Penicillium verrucosum]KAJ5942675.1 hypothetical protein N7516_002843 [Penicillium verrucosum]